MVQIPDAALKLLAEFEGCRSRPYLDAVGIATVGYGHVLRGPDGKPLRSLAGCPEAITLNQADDFLRSDATAAAEGVDRLVKVPLAENQRAALICFAFNVGVSALAGSTLLKKLNAKDYKSAADHFLDWNKGRDVKTGEPVVLYGLTRRRTAEQHLFLTT